MNNINILGTITREPELKYTQGGIAILSFGIAYNEKRKQQDGSYADLAHFFEVTAFGKKAETVNQWFSKGSRILIQGSLDYQSWVDKDGQKRSRVSIKLNDFDFIDKKSDAQSNNGQTNQAHNQGGNSGYSNQYEDGNQANSNQPQQNHTAYREQPRPMPDKNTLPTIDIDEDESDFIPF